MEELDIARRRFMVRHGSAALALLSAGASPQAWAQADYPTRPIKIIVPFAAGSAGDIMTRMIEPVMSRGLGQQVVIENRAGGSGIVGAQAIKNSPPDGYNLVMGAVSSHSIGPAMRPKSMPYDAQRDFTLIGLATKSATVVAVHPSIPARTLPELIAYSKQQDKPMGYASSAIGSSNYLAGEMLRLRGANLVSVAYNNIGQGITDVIGGHVPILIYTVALLPHIREGRLRGIAVVSEKRLSQLPDLTTTAEQGLPDLVANSWIGLFGPAKLPNPVRDKLSASLQAALSDPAIVAKLSDAGLEPAYLPPREFEAYMASDMRMWKDVVMRAGVKTDE